MTPVETRVEMYVVQIKVERAKVLVKIVRSMTPAFSIKIQIKKRYRLAIFKTRFENKNFRISSAIMHD